MTRTADACKICTGCYHSRHEACSRTVQCVCWPPTGAVNACRCCGEYRADAIFEAAVLAADVDE